MTNEQAAAMVALQQHIARALALALIQQAKKLIDEAERILAEVT